MICLVVLLFLPTFTAYPGENIEDDILWFAYKRAYDRTYHGYEDYLRRYIFFRNLNIIRAHNIEADDGYHSYWLGVNTFTDFTDSEFMNRMARYQVEEEMSLYREEEWLLPQRTNAPASVDWTAKGFVTPVKNQKDCGSCWAFSATGALEALYKKKTGKLVSLSEQNLVDCAGGGCGGGRVTAALRYAKRKGIDTELCYPYQAVKGTCRFNESCSMKKIKGVKHVRPKGEGALKMAVVDRPVSVAIDVTSRFRHYERGVFDDPTCTSRITPKGFHAVLVVGYGTEEGKDFWRVKNSWGSDWGMKGYIKMRRNKGNQCRIASFAVFPV